MIEIDGEQGEGGGQLLRSALSLSAWLGRAFRISNIRARRPEPGLKPQHLAAVEIAARVCGAEVSGAERGSRELRFRPGVARPGRYRLAVGTAGAATLVAQTAFPPLWAASGASTVVIEGGTHVPWAPPAEYLAGVFAPSVRRLGLPLDARIVRRGFHPRGGGLLEADVAECASLDPARPNEWRRPARERIHVALTAVVCSLPRTIAERLLARAAGILESRGWATATRLAQCGEPVGAYLFIAVSAENPRRDEWIAGGFVGLGRRGRPAEAVAEEAAGEALDFLESEAAVDFRLADQLLLPAIVSGVALRFRTNRVSAHLRSNADLISRFLGPCVAWTPDGEVAVRAPAETPPR